MKLALLHNINHSNLVEEAEFAHPETISTLVETFSKQYDVHPIECHRNIVSWLTELVAYKPDIIFNMAEGYPSAAREAFYPALYEQLGLLYCGSDPTTLLITHNKALTKQIVRNAGVRTPWSTIITSEHDLFYAKDMISYPVFVKPNSEGSSIGIAQSGIVYDFEKLCEQVKQIWDRFGNIALVEEYIPRGIDVSMTFIEGLGDTGIFGPISYDYPDIEVFDLNTKNRTYPKSILKFPQFPNKSTEDDLFLFMEIVVKVLDVRGYGRADFRINPDGTCYFLEMNGQPAEIRPERSDFMNPVVKAGYSFEQTVLHIVEFAIQHPKRLPSKAGLSL